MQQTFSQLVDDYLRRECRIDPDDATSEQLTVARRDALAVMYGKDKE